MRIPADPGSHGYSSVSLLPISLLRGHAVQSVKPVTLLPLPPGTVDSPKSRYITSFHPPSSTAFQSSRSILELIEELSGFPPGCFTASMMDFCQHCQEEKASCMKRVYL